MLQHYVQMVNVEGEGMYDHKIKGQTEVINGRMKLYLKYMLEICTAEAKWFPETKDSFCGGAKDLRNMFDITRNSSTYIQGIILRFDSLDQEPLTHESRL